MNTVLVFVLRKTSGKCILNISSSREQVTISWGTSGGTFGQHIARALRVYNEVGALARASGLISVIVRLITFTVMRVRPIARSDYRS